MTTPKTTEVCRWQSSGEGDIYETECGDTFQIFEGSPSDNHMEFCCYCGRKLKEEVFNGAA